MSADRFENMVTMVTSTPNKKDQSETKRSPPPPYEDIAVEDTFPALKCKKSLSADPDNKEEITIVIQNDNIACGLDDNDDSTDTESDSSSAIFASFLKVHKHVTHFYDLNKQKILMIVYGLLVAGYLAYFIAALAMCWMHDVRDPTPLIIITVVTVALVIIWYIKKTFGEQIYKQCIKPPLETIKNAGSLVKIMNVIFVILLICGVLIVIAISVWDRPKNLIGLLGIFTFILILLGASKHPRKVRWRPVIGGFFLQFYFAVIILKWDAGKQVFHFIGDKINVFLSFTDNGTIFVFGEKYADHLFAMKVLPVIVFFSCAISVLYYLGAMQAIISKIAWVMRVSLGTTAAESLCAAGNIFIGQTEAPILVGPFLELMTKSELHAVMTGGFATIAGGVLAAYVSFGVPAEHLLCASVMNAPCALAVSKLLYPETEKSKLKKLSDIDISEKKERNILEAAAAGASASIMLVANIAANLIAFLAMLAFVNAVFSWFGSFVGYPEFSFQLLCSYLLMPIAYLMGVEWQDAGVVGELIGIKTFLNEFIAYKELSTYISNRELCVGQILAAKSEIIAIYALCGFANFSSIGIQLGGLGPLVPHRKGELAQVVVRALLGGIIACLITASVAGLLVSEPQSASFCLTNMTSLLTNSTVNSTATYIDTAFVLNRTVTADPLSVINITTSVL